VQPESAFDLLPDAIEGEDNGLFIAGTNTSDDLFMYWRRRVTGLAANATYRVSFDREHEYRLRESGMAAEDADGGRSATGHDGERWQRVADRGHGFGVRGAEGAVYTRVVAEFERI